MSEPYHREPELSQVPGSPTPHVGQPYGAPLRPTAPVRASNGFAVASLIFGLIGAIPLALGFGVAGLVRAAKVRRGMVMSAVAMVLALAWVVPIVLLVPVLVRADDEGCRQGRAAVNFANDYLAKDLNNRTALKADLTAVVNALNEAAGKTKKTAARAALKNLAADFTKLSEMFDKIPVERSDVDSLLDKIDTDIAALNTACR